MKQLTFAIAIKHNHNLYVSIAFAMAPGPVAKAFIVAFRNRGNLPKNATDLKTHFGVGSKSYWKKFTKAVKLYDKHVVAGESHVNALKLVHAVYESNCIL